MKKKQTVVRRKVGTFAKIRSSFYYGFRICTRGFVPVGTFVICHKELPDESGWTFFYLTVLVLGGLLFSAKTVWQWATVEHKDPWKATGFVLLVEGIMVGSKTLWLSWSALLLLVAINGIATGVTQNRRYRV